jgi:hypothetical protein
MLAPVRTNEEWLNSIKNDKYGTLQPINPGINQGSDGSMRAEHMKAKLVLPRTPYGHENNNRQFKVKTGRVKSQTKWVRSKAGVRIFNTACAASSENDRSSAHLQMDWRRLDSAGRSWTSGNGLGIMSYWFIWFAVRVREFNQGRLYYSGESPILSKSYEKPVRMISMVWAELRKLVLIPVANAQSYTPENAAMRMSSLS